MKRISLAVLLAGLGAGCQMPRPLYYWGHYEGLAYRTYAKPGQANPEQQVQELEEDVQTATGKNLAAHPGLHAQLGYLYYQLGKVDQAAKEFETEKALFPESAAFMDRMLGKTKKQ